MNDIQAGPRYHPIHELSWDAVGDFHFELVRLQSHLLRPGAHHLRASTSASPSGSALVITPAGTRCSSCLLGAPLFMV